MLAKIEMKNLNTFKTFFFYSTLILLISSCSSTKINRGKVLQRNIKLNFENCCLATSIKGFGKIKVYERTLKVKIKKGSIKINPEYDNPTYTVGDIYMSLGKYINTEKGTWTTFNRSLKKTLNEKIDSIKDSINISGMIFEIPYTKKSELENSWIVITTTDETRKGTNYSHSKKQKFER